jgi:hypothetical protein
MELVFSQRADSNRAKPAHAQDHSRNARRLLTGKFETLKTANFTVR